jgi:hypothetical protein
LLERQVHTTRHTFFLLRWSLANFLWLEKLLKQCMHMWIKELKKKTFVTGLAWTPILPIWASQVVRITYRCEPPMCSLKYFLVISDKWQRDSRKEMQRGLGISLSS